MTKRKAVKAAGIVGLVLISFLAGARAERRRESISLGEVNLSPGMPEDVVLSKLGDSYGLEKRKNNYNLASWVVRSKDAGKQIVGRVTFSKGKLVLVSKTWANSDDSGAVAIGRAILGVVANIKSEGSTTCTLSPSQEQEPGTNLQSVLIECGPRELEIGVDRSVSGSITIEGTFVTERLMMK